MTDGRNGDAPPEEDEDLAALEFEPLDPDAEATAAALAGMAVPGSVRSIVEGLAGSDPGVRSVPVDGGVVYRTGDRAFARIEGDVASFRLRPEIVAAALRTIDTSSSPLGPDWIAFRPGRFDRFALDRTTSWFGLARRYAGEGPPPHSR